MDIPTKGDLLRVHRKAGYYHFGVAISENRVIHFTAAQSDLGNNQNEIKIMETSLERFLQGDQLEIEEPYNSKFDREEVVKRAKNYANSHLFRRKPYNFVSNNCEHFARYCYDGKAESSQVIAGSLVAVAAATTVATAVIGGFVSRHRKQIAQKKK